MNKKILVIDSDPILCTQLTEYLETEHFQVYTAPDGELGIKMALSHPFDAIVLEILLPKKNGLRVLEAIRAETTLPILFLTSKQDDIDKLLALESGADDFLLKPCDPAELTARLRAILRRVGQGASQPIKPLIVFPGITVDCGKRTVTVSHQHIELTNTEFNILEILIKTPGHAFSKEELTEFAIGRKFTAYDRSIDVHISNLRNKLGYNPKQEHWIKTIRGFGYLFNG
jgi:two-component system, OmpR family, response regulator CpxR